MRHILICFLTFLIFFACTRQADYVDVKYEAERTKDLTTLVEQYTAKFRKKYNMHLRNACLDTDDFGVTKLYLEYTTQRIMEICEARRLTVDVVEEFINNGKNHLVLEDYLPAPLDVFNIELHIHFETFFGKYIDPLYVERVLVSEGMVYFYAFTAFLKDDESQTWDYRSESYGIAKNIVDAQLAIEKEEAEKSVQEQPVDRTLLKQSVEIDPNKLPPKPNYKSSKLEKELENQTKQQPQSQNPSKPQYKNPW